MRKWSWLAAGAALSCAEPALGDSAALRPPQIPTSVFASLPILTKPLMSPNGRRVVARKVAGGRTTLVVLNTDHPETPAQVLELGEAKIYGLTWAGNDRLLVTVRSEGHILHVD